MKLLHRYILYVAIFLVAFFSLALLAFERAESKLTARLKHSTEVYSQSLGREISEKLFYELRTIQTYLNNQSVAQNVNSLFRASEERSSHVRAKREELLSRLKELTPPTIGNVSVYTSDAQHLLSTHQSSSSFSPDPSVFKDALKNGAILREGSPENPLFLLLPLEHDLGVLVLSIEPLFFKESLTHGLLLLQNSGLEKLEIATDKLSLLSLGETSVAKGFHLATEIPLAKPFSGTKWWLRGHYNPDLLFLQLHELRDTFLLIALILTVVTVWMGFLFSKNYTQDLETLVLATERVAEGELSVRVKESEQLELAKLGTAFNRMLSRLEATEETLSRQGELLQATGRMAKVGGWELELRTKRLYWSEEVGRIHETDATSPPPLKELLAYYPGKAAGFVADSLTRLVRNRSGFDIEVPFLTPSGSYKWVRSKARPIIEDGRVVRISGTFQDITDLKDSELLIREAKSNADRLAERALEASLAKSQFLANMSHELRTPMNGVIGIAEVLLESELTADQRSLLSLLKESAFSLVELLNGILDYSKIEAGKLSLSQIEFQPHEVFSRYDALFRSYAEKKGIRFEVEISPLLPKLLRGDPDRIGQIVTNFLSNAIKFTAAEGSVRLEIKVESLNEEQCEVLFSVSDTGIGIEKDNQAHIFEAFSQEDSSTTREYGGTGLGLSISSELANLLGGRIEVQSEKNKGSTFIFLCPLQHVHASKRSEWSALPATNPLEGRTLEILIAEDNLVNQAVLSRLLQHQGHKVTIANNGLEAVDFARKSSFDVILMDIQMPLMSGEEAAGKIRSEENGTRIPIIAITAYASAEDRARCLESGMDEHVSKPVRKAELFEVLAKVVHRASHPSRSSA